MLAGWFRAHPVGASGGGGGGGGGGLDTQTVTTGASGTAPIQDRVRGFISGTLGSITDGTSNIYSGAAITALYWDENEGISSYVLTITGATNTGWTTITIGSVTLYRTAATFSSGTWTWTTTHTAGTQAFGSAGNIKTVTFA